MRLLRRLRRARKAPLAIAGILSTPLFFVALMAFSLSVEKPTVVMRGGQQVLEGPTGRIEASIWLSAFAPAALLLLLGACACLLAMRLAVIVPSVAAIGIAVALLLPLDAWEARHMARYPQGVDLIPKSDPGDLILRGEWEANARHAANQLVFWTIAIAVAAIVIALLLEVRRRRGPVPPPAPPPPEAITGETTMVRRGLSWPWGRPR